MISSSFCRSVGQVQVRSGQVRSANSGLLATKKTEQKLTLLEQPSFLAVVLDQMLRSVQDQTKHGTNFAQRFHLSISSNSNILEWDHSRFLVNQTNSRSKTTTIPCFATTRHARLDYAIKSRFCNRGSITHSSLDFVIEARFSNRASFL